MNNTGSGSLTTEQNPIVPPEKRSVPVRVLILGSVAIVFAVIVGSQVMGVLYAIFFPPVVPLPEHTSLVNHTSKDYGVDDWLYSTSVAPCDVAHFYIENNAQCRIAPLWCTNDGDVTASIPTARGQNVARCEATREFSIFALRYEVIIATGATNDEVTQFRLNREIFWTGAVPPYNPPSLDEEFSSTS